MEDYTIKVHALKSSARIIGATQLSELAGELESAGKNGDRAFTDENTDRLLEMYRSLNDALSWLDGTDEDLPEISGDKLKEAYQTMIEIAGSYDYELMDGILKELRAYRLPPSDRGRISDIENRLTVLDWEGIAEKAGEAI